MPFPSFLFNEIQKRKKWVNEMKGRGTKIHLIKSFGTFVTLNMPHRSANMKWLWVLMYQCKLYALKKIAIYLKKFRLWKKVFN